MWTSDNYESFLETRRQFIADEIQRLTQNTIYNYSNFAVMYRINAQSRAIEDALIRKSIPYRIVGGTRFYDRLEIRDIIAYLRLINNTSDNLAFERIINIPRRGIGKITLSIINEDIYISEINDIIFPKETENDQIISMLYQLQLFVIKILLK